MKPKYWTILILASILIILSVFYYLRQPAAYSGLVVVPHASKTQPQVTTTSQTDLQGWQTYTNSQYNFQFSYPPNLYAEPALGVLFNVQSTPNELVMGCPADQKIGSGYQILAKVLNKSTLDSLISQMSEGGNFVKTPIRLGNLEATRYDLEYACSHGPFVVISNPIDNSDNVILRYDSSSAVCSAKELCIDTQVESIFNQILSTFQFTSVANDVKNLPQDKCPCWDSKNNVCLAQSACE